MCGDGSDVALSQQGVAAFSLSPILLDFSANVEVGFLTTAACGDDTFSHTLITFLLWGCYINM